MKPTPHSKTRKKIAHRKNQLAKKNICPTTWIVVGDHFVKDGAPVLVLVRGHGRLEEGAPPAAHRLQQLGVPVARVALVVGAVLQQVDGRHQHLAHALCNLQVK